MIDPILPLSIALAEARGNYAFFLGSGISRAAEIPTGSEIFWDTVKKLYNLTMEKDGKEEEVKEWFKESEYKEMNYSKILEESCPSPEDRRKFLEKYFIEKQPTKAHYLIAKMVKDGKVKVILTTNFDRLMENALEEKGVKYDVVASADDLKTVKPREHSDCRVLKLHGDYQKFNIRNTEKELKELGKEIKKEFIEVLDRYGIIVIGYSGGDQGVISCFEKRNSKYTLFWLTKSAVNKQVDELIRQQNGRIIKRDSADEFLNELSRKISIFLVHKTGDTPEFLIELTKQWLRSNDEIGFVDELKRQKNELSNHWIKIYNSIRGARDKAVDGLKRFELFTDRIMAIGLVTIEHNKLNYFRRIMPVFQHIYNMPDDVFKEGLRVEEVLYIPRTCLHNMYYCWGSFALISENIEALKTLMEAKIMDRELREYGLIMRNLWISRPTVFDNVLKTFDFLLSSYQYKPFLGHFFEGQQPFSNAVCQFNLLLSLYCVAKNLKDRFRRDAIYPNFLRFYAERREDFMLKLREKMPFRSRITKEIFGENYQDFLSSYKKCCETLNSTYEKELFFSFCPLDCNYFETT